MSKQNVLVPPHKWDDPFENLLLKHRTKFEIKHIEKGGHLIPSSSKVYGQCWTMHRETDAMWRIYSNDKNGAKVKTTPRLLLNAINDSSNNSNAYIGKVQYLNQGDLLNKIDSLDAYTSDKDVAESLLYKRKEFSHEKEVRLVHTNGKGEIYKHAVNPSSLFEEVVFDPRIDEPLYEAYKSALLGHGYSGKIAKSTLYHLPNELMRRK
ncbi:DUF2971 domain-containing protein [Microbulbifer sp. CnH-101-E]|uniref:DUF2971 domain-containing protein n=1 Tax=unclassified Microbulbifer TaxID=2619833 RepID=UPI00403946E7